jgi:hypothetical protein
LSVATLKPVRRLRPPCPAAPQARKESNGVRSLDVRALVVREPVGAHEIFDVSVDRRGGSGWVARAEQDVVVAAYFEDREQRVRTCGHGGVVVQAAQDVRDVIGGDIGVLRAAQIEEGCDAPFRAWAALRPSAQG